jgi:hypothetical protein
MMTKLWNHWAWCFTEPRETSVLSVDSHMFKCSQLYKGSKENLFSSFSNGWVKLWFLKAKYGISLASNAQVNWIFFSDARAWSFCQDVWTGTTFSHMSSIQESHMVAMLPKLGNRRRMSLECSKICLTEIRVQQKVTLSVSRWMQLPIFTSATSPNAKMLTNYSTWGKLEWK